MFGPPISQRIFYGQVFLWSEGLGNNHSCLFVVLDLQVLCCTVAGCSGDDSDTPRGKHEGLGPHWRQARDCRQHW